MSARPRGRSRVLALCAVSHDDGGDHVDGDDSSCVGDGNGECVDARA